MKSAFIRFLSLKEALTGHQVDEELDLVIQRLLEVIAVKHSKGEPINVSEAMQLNGIASPATIHRKMDALIINGYVTLEFEGKNRRTKYITPTEKTGAYFDHLSKVLSQTLAPKTN